MINTEWGVKQVMRSPVALVLFAVLLSAIAALIWTVRILYTKNESLQTELVKCKEDNAETILEMGNQYSSSLLQLRSEQDSSAQQLRQLRQQIAKKRRKE